MDDALRHHLLQTIQKLIDMDFDEEDMADMIRFVQSNVPDPDVYTYMMKDYVEGTTAEEILDRALSYRPIQLQDLTGKLP